MARRPGRLLDADLTSLTRTERSLLVATTVAVVGAAATRPVGGLVAFGFALVALVGVAWLVSFATELTGEHFGPAVTGSLQSGLGNLPELFVAIFALRAGQREIALTSLVGSILANSLLVLGLVIIAGARSATDGTMRFSTRLPNDTATLLQVAIFAIVLVGIANGSSGNAAHHVGTISIVAASCLIVVFFAWLVPYLRSDTGVAVARRGSGPRLDLKLAIVLLVVAGALAALVSDWFINSLTSSIKTLGISKAFAGFVIVAIAGNAAEHTTGVVLAAKGHYEVAIAVVKNSVAQIAAFVFPLLVLISLAFSTHLTFAMNPLYIGALVLTALAIWQITADGEAVLFEGAALVALFIILAVFTWYV